MARKLRVQYEGAIYPAYLQARSQRPAWLRVDRVFGEAGIPKDSAAGRAEFACEVYTVNGYSLGR